MGIRSSLSPRLFRLLGRCVVCRIPGQEWRTRTGLGIGEDARVRKVEELAAGLRGGSQRSQFHHGSRLERWAVVHLNQRKSAACCSVAINARRAFVRSRLFDSLSIRGNRCNR